MDQISSRVVYPQAFVMSRLTNEYPPSEIRCVSQRRIILILDILFHNLLFNDRRALIVIFV